MDCCGREETNEESKEIMKGGNSIVKISKKTVLWLVIGLLVIATIFLTFKASLVGAGNAQTTVSAARTAVSTASGGMVGGC